MRLRELSGGFVDGPSSVVVESDLALGGLEALLDAPADTGDGDDFGKGHLGG
ncbi:hypothetical protein OG210_17680 [Streptomyces sp. NBC_00466]|uniref:hypothetical protein n=1 Tax=Streptomyces sp. NBC_00466 TaxID=2903655 RepID=UPI002E246E69